MNLRFLALPALGWLLSSIAFGADLPDALRVPPAEKLLFSASARGVQVYKLLPKKDNPGQYEWAFQAPEAELFDGKGTKIGWHYAGPTWKSIDGSKVVGKLKAQVPSPTEGAIPWLLLTAKAHEGTGVFRSVTSIQRRDTAGGKPPSAPTQTNADKELRVPYTAVYYFYGPQ